MESLINYSAIEAESLWIASNRSTYILSAQVESVVLTRCCSETRTVPFGLPNY